MWYPNFSLIVRFYTVFTDYMRFSSNLRCLLYLHLVCFLIAPNISSANDPPWWNEPNTKIWVNIPQNVDNYAPVTVGQLKHVAAMARIHLQTTLSEVGGEGNAVAAIVDGFSIVDPGNAAVANIGQLKSVAKPFYDRLAQVGMNWQSGAFGAAIDMYPWTGTTHPENRNPCNIGQLKNVFSFSVSQEFLTNDSDEDGLESVWELYYGFDPWQYTDAWLDPDGDGLSNLAESYAGTNPMKSDTDDDGVSDYLELEVLFSNPFSRDSNGDGVSDFTAYVMGASLTNPSLDHDFDGLTNHEEVVRGTSPFSEDTDGDGVRDDVDVAPLNSNISVMGSPVAGDVTPPIITRLRPL
jgi:hypothetical protein